MNLYHLKYFYDSARLKSITKAAKANSVGQPAISKGIQNLESLLKKDLMMHERNRFQLTDDGETVFQYCQKIFNATDEMKDSLTNQKTLRGEVIFAWQSSMAECDFLTKALKQTNDEYPDINLKLRLGRTDLVKKWVAAGNIDFGVVIENVNLAGLETKTLAKGFFVLVQSKNYFGNWRKDGVLTVEGKPEVEQLQKTFKKNYGYELKLKMEIGSWGVIKKFAMEGVGVGLVPDYMVQAELKNKSLVLVEPKLFAVPYQMKLITNKNKYVSKKAQVIIGHILSQASVVN